MEENDAKQDGVTCSSWQAGGRLAAEEAALTKWPLYIDNEAQA